MEIATPPHCHLDSTHDPDRSSFRLQRVTFRNTKRGRFSGIPFRGLSGSSIQGCLANGDLLWGALSQHHLSAQTGVGTRSPYASSRVGAGEKLVRDFWTRRTCIRGKAPFCHLREAFRRRRLGQVRVLFKLAGSWQTFSFLSQRLLNLPLTSLRLREIAFPLYLRPGTSDWTALRHVLEERDCDVALVQEPRIDCRWWRQCWFCLRAFR